MKTPLDPPETPTETTSMPDWYDPKLHHTATGGIFEALTGVLLGEDGEPASAAVRNLRASFAAAVEPVPEKPAGGRRDTIAILTAHSAAPLNQKD